MAISENFKQQCPSCEANVTIKGPGLIGKKVECPRCKYRFVVEDPAKQDKKKTSADAAGAKKKDSAAKKKPPVEEEEILDSGEVEEEPEEEEDGREDDDQRGSKVRRDRVGGARLEVAVCPIGRRGPEQYEVERDPFQRQPDDGRVEDLRDLAPERLQELVNHPLKRLV